MGRKQDYHNSIIYHIRHMENKEVVYVGSTTNFSNRKGKHKYSCNHEERKEFSSPIYCHIRDNGGFDCFEVIPIKSLKLENKTQLLIAEQEELDKHQTLVNRNKAHITIEELKQYHKQYKEDHKEELKLYHKQYSKQYKEEHKEGLKLYNKQYDKLYREERKEKLKEKIECEACKKILSKCSMYRHIKKCKSKPKEENEYREK